MNRDGFQNLVQLVSKSYLEGRAIKPLVSKEWLEQYHAGLICLSGGLKGEIGWHLLNNREELAEQEFTWLHKIFSP